MIWENCEPLTEEPLGWNDAAPWANLFGLPPPPPPEEIPKDWKPCFIRYGGMPPNGCWYNWDASEYERGLGVFRAYELPDGSYSSTSSTWSGSRGPGFGFDGSEQPTSTPAGRPPAAARTDPC